MVSSLNFSQSLPPIPAVIFAEIFFKETKSCGLKELRSKVVNGYDEPFWLSTGFLYCFSGESSDEAAIFSQPTIPSIA